MDKTIETKICLNCKTQFSITEWDENFYKKMQVPYPTFCPDCRQQRRLGFRNERSLHHRDCDLCGKKIISIYSQKSPLKVYCTDCWYGDKWDPLLHGKDFDFSRNFFEQFAELKLKVPHVALYWRDNENSDYINMSGYNKDCYLIFAAEYNEDCLYGEQVIKSKNCIETLNCYESESCYEVVDVSKCYELFFSQNCRNCHSSMFLYDCRGCSDCLFSANLRNKKYHIMNKSYSKEDYEELKKNLITQINEGGLEELLQQFHKLEKDSIHKNLEAQNNENGIGSFLFDSKNCNDCYDLSYGEDCKYVSTGFRAKDMMDVCHTTDAEITYEGTSLGYNSYNVKFTIGAWTSNDIEYTDTAASCSDLFGCVGLKYKKFCIFNKQYSESEYKDLKAKIIQHMKSTKEYGEFFPLNLSPFGYNETVAQDYYPLTKEKVLAKGLKYKDREEKEYSRQTYNVPKNIFEVDNKIIEEVLSCKVCGKNYKITQSELKFYRKYSLPIPLNCPDCRYLSKLNSRPPRHLIERNCSGCNMKIESTYTPELYTNVLCEKCYLDKIV